MQIRAFSLLAVLLLAGCKASGPFDNPSATPPRPTIPLRAERQEPNKYKPGFTLFLPQDWVNKNTLVECVFQPPGLEGNLLMIDGWPQKEGAEQARDALAEHCAKVERTVSGAIKSTKGSFQSTSGRPVYWVQYPDGGGGGSHTVNTRYFIPAAEGHYEIQAQCDPAKVGSDLAAMTRACDYAAASAQFTKL